MKPSIYSVEALEPWIFIFFGVFHLHRIWGLVDRQAYANFWVKTRESKVCFITCLWGFWRELILKMYDIYAWYWNALWISFVLLGGLSFVLGVKLLLAGEK